MKIDIRKELEELYLKAKEQNDMKAMTAALVALASCGEEKKPLPKAETFDPVVSAKEAPAGTPYDVGDNPRKTQDKW